MKTITLQSFFKMTLLLIGMTVGVGCNDSNNPGEREQEGMDIFCQLVKTVKNGVEIEYPMEIAPSLTLKKDLTFEEIILLLTLMGSCIYATISLTLEICRISFEKQKRPLTISHVSGHNNCPPNIATTIKNSHTK